MDHDSALDEIFNVEGIDTTSSNLSSSKGGAIDASSSLDADIMDVFADLDKQLGLPPVTSSQPSSNVSLKQSVSASTTLSSTTKASPSVAPSGSTIPGDGTDDLLSDLDALLSGSSVPEPSKALPAVPPVAPKASVISEPKVVVTPPRASSSVTPAPRITVSNAPSKPVQALISPGPVRFSASSKWAQVDVDELQNLISSYNLSQMARKDDPDQSPPADVIESLLTLCSRHGELPEDYRSAIYEILLLTINFDGPIKIDRSSESLPTEDSGDNSNVSAAGSPSIGQEAGRSREKRSSFALNDPVLSLSASAEPLSSEEQAGIRADVELAVSNTGSLVKLSTEAIVRVVQSICTARLMPYNSAIGSLAAALATVAPDSDILFVLLHGCIQALFPEYYSAAIVPRSTTSKSTTPVDPFAEIGADGTSSAPSVPAHPISPANPDLEDALHAICQYSDPLTTTLLDQVCPDWFRGSSPWSSTISSGSMSVHGDGDALKSLWMEPEASASSRASRNTPIPWAWLGGLFFSTPGVSPAHLLPLLDRFLLAGAALRWMDNSAQSMRVGVLSYPTPLSLAVLSLIASVILRESVSLRVICRTSGALGPTDAAGAPANEIIEMVTAVRDGRGPAEGIDYQSAKELITATIESSFASIFSRAPENAGAGGGIDAWFAHASSIANSLPQSVLDTTLPLIRTGPSLASQKPNSPNSLFADSSELLVRGADGRVFVMPPVPTSERQTVGITAAELLPQLVYGYSRVAGYCERARKRAQQSKESDRRIVGMDRVASLLPQPSSPTAFKRFILVDVRPMGHRAGGRIPSAYHLDPRTCVPKAPSASAPKLAAQNDPFAFLSSPTNTNEANQVEKERIEALEEKPMDSRENDGPHANADSSAAGAAPNAVSSAGGASMNSPASTPSVESTISSVHGTPSAISSSGMPLSQALDELTAYAATENVHLVVCGIGARRVHAVYPVGLAAKCVLADDERVEFVVQAFLLHGFKHVSTLAGGFAALHSALRGKKLTAPPALPQIVFLSNPNPTPSPGGGLSLTSSFPSNVTQFVPREETEPNGLPLHMDVDDVKEAMRACLQEHTPLKCPSCRHSASLRGLTVGSVTSGGGGLQASLSVASEKLRNSSAKTFSSAKSALGGLVQTTNSAVNTLRHEISEIAWDNYDPSSIPFADISSPVSTGGAETPAAGRSDDLTFSALSSLAELAKEKAAPALKRLGEAAEGLVAPTHSTPAPGSVAARLAAQKGTTAVAGSSSTSTSSGGGVFGLLKSSLAAPPPSASPSHSQPQQTSGLGIKFNFGSAKSKLSAGAKSLVSAVQNSTAPPPAARDITPPASTPSSRTDNAPADLLFDGKVSMSDIMQNPGARDDPLSSISDKTGFPASSDGGSGLGLPLDTNDNEAVPMFSVGSPTPQGRHANRYLASIVEDQVPLPASIQNAFESFGNGELSVAVSEGSGLQIMFPEQWNIQEVSVPLNQVLQVTFNRRKPTKIVLEIGVPVVEDMVPIDMLSNETTFELALEFVNAEDASEVKSLLQ